MVLGLMWGGWARAAESTGKPDVLIYADGDRVRGKFVERVGEELVF